MRIATLPLLALVTVLAGCTAAKNGTAKATDDAPAVAQVLLTPDAKDIHSYANPAEARVTHVAIDLTTDFAAHTLSGSATLDVEAAANARQVILDTRGLTITAVTDDAGKALLFQLGAADPIHGAPLTVTLGTARKIRIAYSTSPDAGALQWLTPAQTAGKKLPYLFSQGEAILNRSWIPTQDSPGIRQTWEAKITVPEGLTAVMSGEAKSALGQTAPNNMRTFTYVMDKPVAPYLIALAVGDLRFQATGPRTGIWTEPSMLEKSAKEFGELEKFVDAAESLYGPYRWGRYDLLVLPPSFPFGGMENPRLTFATPTAIAGDRSLVSLIAHELAHSWSGNLVTNATWNDFWLNEGFTSYFENRIMEKLYGPKRAAMEADLSWSDMEAAVKEAGGPTSKDTQLHLDLAANRSPDDGMTQIAYDKGATFLRTIEAAVGRDKWDAYLRAYFDRHAFQPQTTAGFLKDLRENLIKGDKGLEAKIGIDQWAYQPGIPANAVHVKSDAFPAIDAAAKAFADGGAVAAVPGGVTTQETVRFIAQLPRKLSLERIKALDDRFDWSDTGNSEIRFVWLQLVLPNRYARGEKSAEQFLLAQGRRKFVAPLFTTMMGDGAYGQAMAKRIYAEARAGYHPVTSGTVDKIVGWKSPV
ncbi:M1 family metallopeptidase [Sphingomonas sp. So64.6b]|uniref:M1 family metallopeptidase n=1 Tax=Sphingomonas sp. So64.6b TaxID=2997354 RepID=UPI00160364CE|nr:M1 family metallopeptidase [Sphingomonas sp. So64.6b]QNA85094.1 M1 family metallopeptidase [Sphingomonas sp. So64.6b]